MKRLSATVLFLTIVSILLFSCGKREYEVKLIEPTPPGSASDPSGSKDTLVKIDYAKYLQASIFPGLVCGTEPRVKETINVLFDFYPTDHLRVPAAPLAQFSTGLYAAPGELIAVDIPRDQTQLYLQIGAWTDNVGGVENAQRDGIIFTKQLLSPGKNYVRNLYGGHIYLFSATRQETPVAITIDGAAKSPDFILGQTDAATWRTKLATSCVPFLELRSENAVFVISREDCITRPFNPAELMTEWNNIISEDVYGWEGLEDHPADPVDQTPRLPYRFVLDADLSTGPGSDAHGGQPVVARNTQLWYQFFTNIKILRTSSSWGAIHELGHTQQQSAYWSWSSLGEVTNNLFIWKQAARNEMLAYANAWPAKHNSNGIDYNTGIANSNLSNTFAECITNYVTANIANKNFDVDGAYMGPFQRMLFFVQMFDYIKPNMPGVNETSNNGWDLMTQLYKKARRAVRPSASDLAKHDFLYEAVCDLTKRDWQLFFQNWGVSLSDIARQRMTTKYPIMIREVWKYNPATRTGGTTDAKVMINSFSSQATNEGAPNGLVTALIDGSTTTYWHTSWSPQVQPPHWVIIDYLYARNIKGFRLMNRPSGVAPAVTGAIKNLRFEISNNLTTWTQVGGSPFGLQAIRDWQTVNFATPAQARYVRIYVNNREADIWSGSASNYFVCVNEFEIIE